MVVLKEKCLLKVDRKTAFKFLADFSNTQRWDPGVRSAKKITEGPPGIGTKYELVTLFNGNPSDMTYTTTEFEMDKKITLFGETPSSLMKVYTYDYIEFKDTSNQNETLVEYTADIRLRGLLFFAIPFVTPQIKQLGKDAVKGMQDAFEKKEHEKVATS